MTTERQTSVNIDEKIDESVAILREARARHGDKVVYPCSLGAEGMVLIDLIRAHVPEIRVLTLDTGRLPEATYDLMEEVERHFDIRLDVHFPATDEVEEMVREHGVDLFRKSPELRRLCCEVRKVRPLRRALEGMEAWITGRRRDQSSDRTGIEPVEDDPVYGLRKYNPLYAWSEAEVWDYIRERKLPYNRLHDEFYVSIGCAPCTRAVAVGEDPRAGRWWWENEETMAECGLHVSSPAASRGEGEGGEGI